MKGNRKLERSTGAREALRMSVSLRQILDGTTVSSPGVQSNTALACPAGKHQEEAISGQDKS